MKNLEDLKIGDEVIVVEGRDIIKHTVERITKTLIKVAGIKYNKSSGEEIGSYSYSYIKRRLLIPTDTLEIKLMEKELKEKKRNLARRISNRVLTNFNAYSTEFLEEMLKVLN